ncbi:hypothetical protein [Bacillus alkalicellulosilyticus]|uniref:hypothetical protein n=1 Tax=Alkalihalobacterium alkalicellulosilyticum TaxID=1912214 RepID=UPI000997F54B|nr:hypothetical protein [Bacillus alkalicellulosilyticus]
MTKKKKVLRVDELIIYANEVTFITPESKATDVNTSEQETVDNPENSENSLEESVVTSPQPVYRDPWGFFAPRAVATAQPEMSLNESTENNEQQESLEVAPQAELQQDEETEVDNSVEQTEQTEVEEAEESEEPGEEESEAQPPAFNPWSWI